MPGHEDMATAAGLGTPPAEQQSRVSRRTALRTAATAGIAVTALATASAPALAAAGPTRADHTGPEDTSTGQADAGQAGPGQAEADPGEPIIAHLRDAGTGEIDVFRGTTRVRLSDPALAAVLIRASRSAASTRSGH